MVTSPVTLRTTHPRALPISSLRSSCWTTPARSTTATPPSWIATRPTLPANSPRSRRSAIVVRARRLRRTPSSSSLTMPPWSPWCPPSLSASSLSPTSLLWVAYRRSWHASNRRRRCHQVRQLQGTHFEIMSYLLYFTDCSLLFSRLDRRQSHQGRGKGRQEKVNGSWFSIKPTEMGKKCTGSEAYTAIRNSLFSFRRFPSINFLPA